MTFALLFGNLYFLFFFPFLYVETGKHSLMKTEVGRIYMQAHLGDSAGSVAGPHNQASITIK